MTRLEPEEQCSKGTHLHVGHPVRVFGRYARFRCPGSTRGISEKDWAEVMGEVGKVMNREQSKLMSARRLRSASRDMLAQTSS